MHECVWHLVCTRTYVYVSGVRCVQVCTHVCVVFGVCRCILVKVRLPVCACVCGGS